MNRVTYGDLAQNFQARRTTMQVKTELARLTGEVSSGRKADVSVGTSGDFLPVVSLERAIASISAFETSIAEARLFAESMQTSLDKVQTHAADLSPTLLTAGNAQNATMIDAATADAASRFRAAVSAFNTKIADRYAFAGTAIDAPPLADPQVILDDLKLAIAGQTTATGVEAALDTWFDTPGGGYDTIAYLGAGQKLGPIRVGEGEDVDLSLTAADDGVRATLKSFAMAALVDEGALAGDIPERAAMTRRAGEMLVEVQPELSAMRADIGTAEARIAAVGTASAAEKSVLKMARNDIVAADPYAAATALEARRAQLETIFTVTARLSHLNLVEFLR